MTTAWTLAAAEICTDALEHLNAIGDGDAASGGDMQLALRALDAVLKELPLVGYSWPKLSGEVALPWAAGQTIPLPADYYGSPYLWRVSGINKVPLIQIPHGRWVLLANREAQGVPSHYYIDPSNAIHLWPAPTVDPVASLQYQKIVSDAQATLPPDVAQFWVNPLGYGVANELLFKFAIPESKAQQIAARWVSKRALALESSIASEAISFEVRD